MDHSIKSEIKVHKICSNGTKSFFALEGADYITFKTLSKNKWDDCNDNIKLRAKNNKLIVYRCYRDCGAKTVRNITRKPDILDRWIKYFIKNSCSRAKNEFARVGKYNKVKKMIADFAHKHFGFKVKKSKNINDLILNILFPINEIPVNEKQFICDMTFDSKSQGSKSVPEYLDRFIGKKRPKKLNKILYSLFEKKQYTSFINVVLAYKYSKGIVDINHFYSLIENPDFWFTLNKKATKKTYYIARKFLKKLPLRLYNSLMNCKYIVSSSMIDDTIKQLMELDDFVIDSNIRDIRDLHDMVSIGYRRKREKDFSLKNHEEILALDGAQIEDMQLVVPKTSHELVGWGGRMRNCIASYAKSVNGKQRYLLGVKQNGELKYNIEISNKIVRQFSGTGNSSPNKDERKLVMDYLESKKLLSASTYNQFAMDF